MARFNSNNESIRNKPFFTIKDSSEDKFLWLNQMAGMLQSRNQDLFSNMKNNLLFYIGDRKRYGMPKATMFRSVENLIKNYQPKFIINHLYEITEGLVSKMTRIKPSIDILPANDEFQDVNAAKASKFLIKHIWEENKLNELLINSHRNKFIFGESFIFITWNRDKGDLHPLYVQAQEKGKKLQVLDDKGNSIRDISAPVRVGDVDFELELPFRVLLEDVENEKELSYCFRISYRKLEELEVDYPDKKGELKADINDYEYIGSEDLVGRSGDNYVTVYEFFHKPTKYLKEGAHIVFTASCILDEADKYPYSHEELPFVRMTDIDVPGRLHGESFFSQVKSLQNMYDNLSSQIMRNQATFSAPALLIPQGAINPEQVTNDVKYLIWKGAVPPSYLKVEPTPREVFEFRDRIRQEMDELSKLSGMTRGEPPKGVTAAVAMQFLNEQEMVRETSAITKHNESVRAIAKMALAVAGDYYEPEDGRLLRIIGKENKYMLKYFDASNLHRGYDVRIDTASALPDSKAGKLEKIFQTMQYHKELLPSERWVELLDFGSDERMNTLITSALRAADSENEDILNGEEVGAPEDFEDTIAHLSSHYKAVQNRSFKEEIPEPIVQKMLDHIGMHERVAYNKAKENPLFQAKLAQLELFPLVYKEFYTPISQEHAKADVEGAANRGDMSNNMIPATMEPEDKRLNTSGKPKGQM